MNWLISTIAGAIYAHQIKYWGKATSWTASKLRNCIIQMGDPYVRMMCGTRRLKMRLSHNLPFYRALYPLYDRALPRIAAHLEAIDGEVCYIDIGANIGDTAALVFDAIKNGSILCIEGDDGYLPLLNENLEGLGARIRVVAARAFLGEKSGIFDGVVERSAGTSRLTKSECQALTKPYVMKSLDDLLISDHPEFSKSNFLKIDVDGFECSVIGGAQKFLCDTKPLVFFEFFPKLLLEGGNDPRDLFRQFLAAGYQTGLIYNIIGQPLARIDFSNEIQLAPFIHYQNDSLYAGIYDVLTFHRDRPKYSEILVREQDFFHQFSKGVV